MNRRRARGLPLPLFVAISLSLHGAALRTLGRSDHKPEPRFDPTSQGLVGQTLDVEATPAPTDEAEEMPAAAVVPASPSASPNTQPQSSSPSSSRSTSAPGPAPTANRAAWIAPGTNASAAGRPALFGAVGARFSSDLATTFTRAFPQAASADPVWRSVPSGSSSSAELTLVLDDDGHLARSALSGSPSAALRDGIQRTLALLGTGRAFTAHGPVTRIRVTARVTRDDVHDGLHGDVFALSGGSFSGDVGNAFFALPSAEGPGRRIDVELRLLP